MNQSIKQCSVIAFAILATALSGQAGDFNTEIHGFDADQPVFEAGSTGKAMVPLRGTSNAPGGQTVEARAVYTVGSANSSLLEGVEEGDDWQVVLDRIKENAPRFRERLLETAVPYDPDEPANDPENKLEPDGPDRWLLQDGHELELVGKDLPRGFSVGDHATLRLKDCVIRGPILRKGLTGNIILEDCLMQGPGDASGAAPKTWLALRRGPGLTYVGGLFITGYSGDPIGRGRNKDGTNNGKAVLKCLYVDAPSPGPKASRAHVDIFQFGGANRKDSHSGENIDTELLWSVFVLDTDRRLFAKGPQDDNKIAINDAFYLENVNGTVKMRFVEIITGRGRPINIQGPGRGRLDAAFLRLEDDKDRFLEGGGEAVLQSIINGQNGSDLTSRIVGKNESRTLGTAVAPGTGADARQPLLTEIPAVDWTPVATTAADGSWSGELSVPATEFRVLPQTRLQGAVGQSDAPTRVGVR